jgi:hypothetical protein
MIKTRLLSTSPRKQLNPYYMLFYTIFTICFLLFWLCPGFSMASSRGSCKESYPSRGSCKESYPSFLNNCMSLVQGLAMLKSRHIPTSETRHFGSSFFLLSEARPLEWSHIPPLFFLNPSLTHKLQKHSFLAPGFFYTFLRSYRHETSDIISGVNKDGNYDTLSRLGPGLNP